MHIKTNKHTQDSVDVLLFSQAAGTQSCLLFFFIAPKVQLLLQTVGHKMEIVCNIGIVLRIL